MTPPSRTVPLAVAAMLLAALLGVGALLVTAAPAWATQTPSESPTESPSPPEDGDEEDIESGDPGEGSPGPTTPSGPQATAVDVPAEACAEIREGTDHTVAVTGLPDGATIEMTANDKTYLLGACQREGDDVIYPTYDGNLLSVSEDAEFSVAGDFGDATHTRAFPAALSAQNVAAQAVRFELTEGTMSYPSSQDPEDGRDGETSIPTPPTTPPSPSPSEPGTTPPPSSPDEAPEPSDEAAPAPRAPETEQPYQAPTPDQDDAPATGNGRPPSEQPGTDGEFSPNGPAAPEYDYSDPVPQPPGDSGDSPDAISGPSDQSPQPEAQGQDADPTTGTGIAAMVAVPLVALVVIAGLLLLLLAMRRRKKGAHEA